MENTQPLASRMLHAANYIDNARFALEAFFGIVGAVDRRTLDEVRGGDLYFLLAPIMENLSRAADELSPINR